MSTCDGHGHEDCFCAGDHCGCGNDRIANCPGCSECRWPEPRLRFRVVASTNPRFPDLWRLETRGGHQDWRLVSDGLTNDEVDKQVVHAHRDGFKIDDRRSKTPGQLFQK